MYHPLKKSVQEQLLKARIPFAATIEVTKRCHLNCCHCYVNHLSTGKELTITELNNLVDQLIELGTFIVAFSGGEVFLKKGFRELLKTTAQKNIGVKLLTSATLMRPEDIPLLKKCNVMEVGISIYGSTPEMHDQITGYRGSFEQSIEMMKQIIDAGIVVSGRMPVMTLNQHEIIPVHRLLTTLDAIPLFDLNITPSEDHVRPSERYRLSQNEITQLLSDQTIRDILFNIDPFETLYCIPGQGDHPLDLPRCGIGQSTIWIDAFGDVYPCIQYPEPVGNLRKKSLKEIWYHNAVLDQIIENSRFKYFTACHSCPGKDHCSPCMGIALQEGEKNRCSAIVRSIAMATKTVSEQLKE